MRTPILHALASATLGLLLAASPVMATDAAAELDFAGAKAKAAADNKLILVDFSAPT